MLKEITQKEWGKGGMVEPLVLYFYTPLCGTCKVGEKMLEVVSELVPHVSLFKININLAAQLAEDWKIESVPCLVVVQEKKPVNKIYALNSVPYLYEVLKPLT